MQIKEGDDLGFVNGFGWQAVALGYGCGFVVGIGIGYCLVLGLTRRNTRAN